MVWDKRSNYWIVQLDNDSDYSVSIIGNTNKWYATYNPPGKIGGFLSSNLRIECGYGLASAIGLPDSCCFNTREEAIEIAEKHQKLLVLQ